MAIVKTKKRQHYSLNPNDFWNQFIRFSSKKFFRLLLILILLALIPPIFFHFTLRRIQQLQSKKCGWIKNPPLVCAHGGDPTKAFPNTIKELGVKHLSHQEFHEQELSTVEDALMLISKSVRHVVLDAKVGPPKYEQGLAKDILSIVRYIVMSDPSTGARTNLLRMKKAGVVGVYHPLVDDKLVRVLHGRNKKVYSWTVDDADSVRRMLIEQVDGVVTNHPAKLRRLMQDMRTQCLEDGFPLPR